MTNHKDRILSFLSETNKCYCDDCLSELLEIEPRQAINTLCNKLNKADVIKREKSDCFNCKQYKLSNSTIGRINILDVTSPNAQKINNSPAYISKKPVNQNRLSFDEFENRVKQYLEKQYNDTFTEKALVVGENKVHKFDLVSQDHSIVIECKSYTWTGDDNFPSGKISTAIEAIFYLSRIKASKKVIAFQDSYSTKGESLVDTFVRRYDGLFDDTEIWVYNVNGSLAEDVVEVKRKGKKIWYKELYKPY